MKESVLNNITTFKPVCAFFEWCNGKKGYIVKDLLYERFEFIEGYRDKYGHLQERRERPVVAVGIVAYWLKSRNSGVPVRQMFEDYTEERYEQIKFYYRDEPSTWDWDDEQWKIAFYKWAIENEPKSNKESEALLEYITDSDKEKVRALMEKYMDYLEKCLEAYQASSTDEEKEKLLDKIYIYFKDEETAKRFLDSIKKMDDTEIVRLVRKYSDSGLCTDTSKSLWKLLSEGGFYKSGYPNWNKQMNQK